MCAMTISEEKNSQARSLPKLMVSAFVCLENNCALSTEVKRGMPILSKEGRETGKVAAVLLDSESHSATHILLSRLPDTPGYWMVPVAEIAQVREGAIWLRIPEEVVNTLSIWHPGE